MKAAILTLLLLGCRSGDTIGGLALSSSLAAWHDVGLPEPDEGCYGGFSVRRGVAGEVERLCPGGLPESRACLVWERPAHRPLAESVPVALIKPDVAVEPDGEPVIHEVMHLLVHCGLHWDWPDIYDARHTDPRVWVRAGHDESAQALARSHFGGE